MDFSKGLIFLQGSLRKSMGIPNQGKSIIVGLELPVTGY
jgi:hypothetical protein